MTKFWTLKLQDAGQVVAPCYKNILERSGVHGKGEPERGVRFSFLW